MGLYLGKEKISNLSVGQATSGVTNISDETTINISGILKGENNKIVPATPGVDYVIPGDSTVTSVNEQTGAVILSASDIGAQSTITASGILKGNGAGGVTAAEAGTDYMAPIAVTSADNGKVATVVNGVWSARRPTSYGPFRGASASANGAVGLVPSPNKGQQNRYLKGDGTWADVLPQVAASDNGKFMRVVNGAWAIAKVDNASGVSF